MNRLTMSVAELKTACMAVLDQLAAREVDEVVVTKDGRIVGVMKPVEDGGGAAGTRPVAAPSGAGRHP